MALITNGDTHSPETWSEAFLEQLVPIIASYSEKEIVLAEQAKTKLRPAVIELVGLVREAERAALAKNDPKTKEAVVAAYKYSHGLRDEAVHYDFLHHETKKLRGSNYYVDSYVQKVCRIASQIDGNIGHNSMVDEVYRILDLFVKSVQSCERSHYVTHNQLHNDFRISL